MPDLYRGIEHCRSCGSDNLDEVLDLGSHCLSNFLEPGEPQPPKVPLIMARCANCTLVQLMHTVDRERLFRRYWYHSGGNESMVAALKDVVEDACEHTHAGSSGDLWLDIGANDGTLVEHIRTLTMATSVGIDPAPQHKNVLRGFFPEELPAAYYKLCFKVITSIACFYASDDPNAFAAAIKRILHPEGVWVLQLQDLDSVVRDRAFDYVCHEHLTLWDPWSLDRLLAQHGLEIGDISRNDVNGGSVRFTIRHGHHRFPGRSEVPHDWDAFKRDIEANKEGTLRFLDRQRKRGLMVGGLAASTKFNTVLQYYGLGPEHIAAIGERNPDKVGRTTVTGIPIVSEDTFRAMKPDYAVIGAWQFRESIMKREAEMSLRGTRFLTLIPALHTWDQEWLAA